MQNYIPNTESEINEMLEFLGLNSCRDLYVDVPADMLYRELNIPEGKSELEVRKTLCGLANKNTVFDTVLRGAGAYNHYIPSIVRQVSSKETFVTAYTPYQAEISQGVLQAIFEYQSEICNLTDMDVSNASVYDGASAAAEAAAMCRERKRQKVYAAKSAHPDTIDVMRTYSESSDSPFFKLEMKNGRIDINALAERLDDETACVYVQSPNFFGLIEDVEKISEVCHAHGVKFIYGCNPIALACLKTPGDANADIAVGDAQCLGLPIAFGGPYLGFMACKKDMMRKLPGRIVGQTKDADGKRCFVLTLQAREQHIRREKAISSICSNQALCALTATVYLASMGPEGLRQAAVQSASKAAYLASGLSELGFARVHDGEFFHEFVSSCPVDKDALLDALAQKGILGGLPVDEGILWCCTELVSKDEIDTVVSICGNFKKGRE